MVFNIEIVGYIAGFLTAVAQFPQAYKIIKTNETHSISVGMYFIMTLGIFFWLFYGILLSNWPMILCNGITLIPALYILFITIRNWSRSKKQTL